MKPLPHSLYRAEQVRELDRIAIDEFGIPGLSLMQRAGLAAFEALRRRWPRARHIGVLCGTGNNGGDGFVLAGLAQAAGLRVSVWQVGDASRIRGDALSARQQMTDAGLRAEGFVGQDLSVVDVLVDGLLGTGLGGEVSGIWREAIEAANAARDAGCGVLALDIPSGLQADTGAVQGAAVRADVCVTFIGLKLGLFTGQGPDYCGEVSFDDLDVPPQTFTRFAPAATRLAAPAAGACLPPRRPCAHKGDFGHVLVVGGEHGMSGAARLAGEAALRCGAGLVSLATRAEHAAAISAARPELMCHGVGDAVSLKPLLRRATVLAIGPGLGQGAWGRQLLGAALASPLPLVVDADALNLLAAEPVPRSRWVLTPHPGEAARLLGRTSADIQADRLAAARALQRKYGGVVVLKGAGTLVVDSTGDVSLCDAGNPGMASGGMGDVLTGVIAALMAQGLRGDEAARRGVCLHAAAADRAAGAGQRGLLASDLFPPLRELLA
ncbi:MAG TPA: NAD(P)H-hydrate dehydratase [Gammaproteobacteria bacterium]|nr:NAD(P)H-hydrate dehydratase [Gammaproteobacteria bacterium]